MKTVKAFDIYGNIYERPLNNFRIVVRVYGLLKNGNDVLVQRNKLLQDKYGLPGGEVEIDETLLEALKREFLEETGLKIEPGNLLTVAEDFFTFADKDYHSILILYTVNLKGGEILKEGNQEETAEVIWMDKNILTEGRLQRGFAKFLPYLLEPVAI